MKKETLSTSENEIPKIKLGLQDKYQAQISEADATIKIYLNNSVGIGEHPQHLEEINKLMQKIVDASEKLKEIQHFKL